MVIYNWVLVTLKSNLIILNFTVWVRLGSVRLDFAGTWPNRHPSWFYSRNSKQVNYYGLSFLFLFYCIYWFLFKTNVLRLVHFLCCYLCWFFCIVMLFLSELSVMYWGSYQLWIREAGNWSKSKRLLRKVSILISFLNVSFWSIFIRETLNLYLQLQFSLML